jgi:lysophospholipase L1-like esterase
VRQPVTVYLIGDSTVNNGTKGQKGWGSALADFFDPAKVRVVNRARGGRSSRTFLTEGLWATTRDELKPGDVVLMQFGHNDGGEKFKGDRPRGSIRGNGEETESGVVEMTGKQETVHSYGWYLRTYIAETKAKGAIPVVCSPVPRNIWRVGRVGRAENDYGRWSREAAWQGKAYFLPLNDLIADKYDTMGETAVAPLFFGDHTHTSPDGATFNARCVIEGIQKLRGLPILAAVREEARRATPKQQT